VAFRQFGWRAKQDIDRRANSHVGFACFLFTATQKGTEKMALTEDDLAEFDEAIRHLPPESRTGWLRVLQLGGVDRDGIGFERAIDPDATDTGRPDDPALACFEDGTTMMSFAYIPEDDWTIAIPYIGPAVAFRDGRELVRRWVDPVAAGQPH
jgi:hypothetical protein